MLYAGDKTREISFPLGGIGTGCIGLAGNGRLIDWEIFNRPNKGGINGFSHFAIKAEAGERGRCDSLVDARVLNSDLPPSYTGTLGTTAETRSFGRGPQRESMAGMPHLQKASFKGEFPFAELQFERGVFPADVNMRAFNPFIPLDDIGSGIPAAFFEFTITNQDIQPLRFTLAGTLGNPFPDSNINRFDKVGKIKMLCMGSDKYDKNDVRFGDLSIATDAEDTSYQEFWFRGKWFDGLEVFWRDFTSLGKFKNRNYSINNAGRGNNGTLAAHFTLESGETKSVRFVISWNFPNCENYWNKSACRDGDDCCCGGERDIKPTWKNYYATIWDDSTRSAGFALENWDRLHGDTHEFKKALFAATMPAAAVEAVSANLSVLKSPTVMRLEDGTFYGFEGCHATEGCCEGSCTHVWNYAQALPFLFPKLERSMRDANYAYNLREDGAMPFRLQLPLGSPPSAFRPCADGQFGDVLKTYRDWKICGDSEWLAKLWPALKKSIEYSWSESNKDRWDPDKTGVLQGRQHHTLDMELFGPNAWLSGFYLAALKAAAEMADHFGEDETAKQYRELFSKGKKWADKHLFNGEYYHQLIDISDKSLLEDFEESALSEEDSAVKAYWDEEHEEIMYQIGEGCEIDQVLAQWHANLYGLGEIFDPDQTRTALKSLFEINFKKSMRNFYNPCRNYCLNDEGGLVIAEWPEGKRKPMIPLPYSQETQNGYEYAAAIQMIQSGLVEEGMIAVAAIRDRYDGEKRNPWNEFECGSNYARSMAAYSLLNAFSGFSFDMVKGEIGFNPIEMPAAPADGHSSATGEFRTFWSLDSGCGEFVVTPELCEIRLMFGEIQLRALDLPFLAGRLADAGTTMEISLFDSEAFAGTDENSFPENRFRWKDGKLIFADSVVIGEGTRMQIRINK